MYKRVKRIATVLILVGLLLLFTLPRAYLSGVCGEIAHAAEEVRQAVQRGDEPAGALARMQRIYADSAPTLRLFLDHVSVDSLGVAIVACGPLKEPEHLLSTLNEVDAAAEHLLSIESLSADSLF